MEYLKHELERTTGSLVTIHRLFDFIHEITFPPHHQLQGHKKNLLLQFEVRWKGILTSSSTLGNSFITYIDGCWLPKVCRCLDVCHNSLFSFHQSLLNSAGVIELQRQSPWNLCIKKYCENGVAPFSIRIEDQPKDLIFTPFNFNDLVQITFWEEMYNLHGSDVVRFIFEKCLILFPIEESFYLAICHKTSLFHKKITASTENGHFRNRILRKLPSSADVQGYRASITDTNNMVSNPYAVPDVDKLAMNSVIYTYKRRRLKRKRRQKLKKQTSKENVLNNQDCCPSKKTSLSPAVASKNNCNANLDFDPNISTVIPESDQGGESQSELPFLCKPKMRRWVKPSKAVQQMITESRELSKQKKSSALSSSIHMHLKPEVVSTFQGSSHVFVNIMDDKYFKDRDIISKENHFIFPTEPLPKQLAGVVLPASLIVPGERTQITVHRMSETKAREFKLKVNSRKRRRRKNSKVPDVIAIHHQKIPQVGSNPGIIVQQQATKPSNTKLLRADTEPLPGPSRKRNHVDILRLDGIKKFKLCIDKDTNIITSQDVTCNVENVNLQHAWKSFNPNIALETYGIVHNKFSGNKWPDSCDMGRAVTQSTDEGVKFILEQILNCPVLGSSHKHTKPTIEKLKEEGKLNKLEVILKEMLQFHKRAKDLTKLMKNCVCFWIGKLNMKSQKRNDRKQARLARKAELQTKAAQIEVIDLTSDTTSTNFSGSQLNSQPLNPCCISTLTTSSTCGDRGHGDSLLSHHGRIHYANSYLSTTPTKSQSQRDRKKFMFSKLKENVSPSCILSSISQILFLSGVQKVLDHNINRKGFLTFLRKSIILGGIKSAMQLGQLMSLVDASNCSWLMEIDDVAMKDHLFAKIVSWLFTEYVLVLLKTCFYVTELSNSRFQLSFFLRDTWRSVSDGFKDQLIKKGTLKKQPGRFGIGESADGRMRLIPKQNLHVRPILSLNKSINKKLNIPHCKLLLNYICGILAPHGISDASSFCQRWKYFLQTWKTTKCPTLYYIRLDIRDAYPSVRIEKLKEILLETCTAEEELTAKRFVIVGRADTPKTSLVNLPKTNRNWHTSIFNRPSIIVNDMEKDVTFDKSKVLESLLKTLVSNIIIIGQYKFTFSHGLPQGWALSQSLCNIYYGHMDRKHFSEYINQPDEFFVRSVDDYFYVSPSPQRIANFFHRMKCGLPDYNCNINPDKSLTNLYVQSNKRMSLEENDWVKYCGWKFCVASGHIKRDFSSYAGQDFCSTLSFLVNKSPSPEDFIRRRMKMLAPARLKYLILDPAINCRERILMTIYEAGLVFAFRFYAACRVLFKNLNSVADREKGAHLFRSIVGCASKLSKHICQHKFHLYSNENTASHECYLKAKLNSCDWSCVPQSTPSNTSRKSKETLRSALSGIPKCGDQLSELEVLFLVYQAFLQKLSVHSGVFNVTILPKLRKAIRKLEVELVNLKHHHYLLNISGKCMPKHFQDMKI